MFPCALTCASIRLRSCSHAMVIKLLFECMVYHLQAWTFYDIMDAVWYMQIQDNLPLSVKFGKWNQEFSRITKSTFCWWERLDNGHYNFKTSCNIMHNWAYYQANIHICTFTIYGKNADITSYFNVQIVFEAACIFFLQRLDDLSMIQVKLLNVCWVLHSENCLCNAIWGIQRNSLRRCDIIVHADGFETKVNWTIIILGHVASSACAEDWACIFFFRFQYGSSSLTWAGLETLLTYFNLTLIAMMISLGELQPCYVCNVFVFSFFSSCRWLSKLEVNIWKTWSSRFIGFQHVSWFSSFYLLCGWWHSLVINRPFHGYNSVIACAVTNVCNKHPQSTVPATLGSLTNKFVSILFYFSNCKHVVETWGLNHVNSFLWDTVAYRSNTFGIIAQIDT